MSKQQRVPGEDLLFSQSELAELDAELAPQADEAAIASARTPPQATPPSLDDLVESAFSDEETAERQVPVSGDLDLGSSFVGFVEAEPASTGEILAAMAEQPISSAPALEEPLREPSKPLGLATGEITGSGSTPTTAPQELPSVIFDDSPFHEGEHSSHVDPAEIAPQLAALAAAIDKKAPKGLPVADTVLSSSPPPSDDNLQVEVVTAGGGSLPNLRAPALVALSHTVDETAATPTPTAEAAEAEHAEAPERPSGNTPVMALDDHEFQLVEDSEDQPVVPVTGELEPVHLEEEPAALEEAPTEPPAEMASLQETPASDEGTSPPVEGAAEPNIDAAWSAVVDENIPPIANATVEDLSPVEPSPGAGHAAVDAVDQPLSSRITPILGTPVIEITASGEDSAPDHLAAVPEAEGAGTASADLTETLSATAVAAAEAASLTAAAAPIESSKVSPAREVTAPPIPRDALRRTSPGVAPPPPPAAALAPPPVKPAVPAPPPPVPAAAAAPPPPAAAARPPAALAANPPPAGGINFGEETKLRKKRRSKQWFEEIFDEDYLHTLPFMTPHQTEREVAFLLETLELPSGGRVLDIGCGYGRHAMEMAARGYRTVGLDLSLPLLIRATDAARHRSVNVDFVHGDMRDMTFEGEFDGAYCFFTTFGYYDDDTNRRVAAGICRALKPGGRFVLEMINRDYLIGDLPTRVWWQGDGCVVLEEVDFNYFTSRLQVQRQIILENGRQLEQEISIRAYSLHEIGKVLHHAGFRVLEVSGNLDLRGRFYGNESRQLVVVAERRTSEA